MYKRFKLIRTLVSKEEKEKRLNDYLEECKYFGIPPTIDTKSFLETNLYDEKIHLRCMKCHFEGIYDWEIIRETWDKRKSYPTNRCPKCGKPQFVPLDIYNEKKKSP